MTDKNAGYTGQPDFVRESGKRLTVPGADIAPHAIKWEQCLTEGQKEKLLHSIKVYIQEQYASRITRRDIANTFFINADYLSRLFNKKFGMSIPDYITQLRVERAKELLHTTLSVSAVSSLVGIDNYSYFSKVFKKEVGLTPSAYRKKTINHAQ